MGHEWPCSELVVLDTLRCSHAHIRCTEADADYFRAEINCVDTGVETDCYAIYRYLFITRVT